MRVLYATDGSAPARSAERLIASLFDPSRCQIEAFSVTPEPLYMAPVIDSDFELARLDVSRGNAEQIAGEAADHLRDKGFTAISSASRGDPARQILHKLEDDDYDLVVLGASHTSWMGTLLLGSVSMHVLHHAPCSVVVTHRSPAGSGKVLVGIDGSEASFEAAEHAMRVLDRSKCAFTLATVVSQPPVAVAVYPPGLPLASYTETDAIEKQRVSQAWQLLERTARQTEARGFATEKAVLQGAAGEQLLKEAENIQAELTVVGSRGISPIRRAFLGSVSDQITRHSPATFVGRPPAASVEHPSKTETQT